MLFIVYGASLEIGSRCREMFKGFGFDIIKKYNYIAGETRLDKSLYENPEQDEVFSRWYNDKVYVGSLEEIERCDFCYELDGVSLGFNKTQVMDAVHGAGDALLTIGAASLDFAIQLKRAYGDYVTLLSVFSDRATVISDNKLSKRITESELEARNAANLRMQKIYLQNLADFDGVVIYTGEGSVFDLEMLEKQFSEIIRDRRKIEKELNGKNYIELPYKGSKDYLFISYSHKDREKVYADLQYLQRQSCRVWYDDGIHGGENWRRILVDKILNCRQLLLFASKDSAVSKYVTMEINCALDNDKPIVVVDLDGYELPLEYRYFLSNSNRISYADENYHRKLLDSISGDLIES